jgi:hypothetical protein
MAIVTDILQRANNKDNFAGISYIFFYAPTRRHDQCRIRHPTNIACSAKRVAEQMIEVGGTRKPRPRFSDCVIMKAAFRSVNSIRQSCAHEFVTHKMTAGIRSDVICPISAQRKLPSRLILSAGDRWTIIVAQ